MNKNTTIHVQTIHNCIRIFQEQHGINHDVFIHSHTTYKMLRKTLANEANFEYDEILCRYDNNIFSIDSQDTMCKYVVDNVEWQVLNKIYKKIHDSNNPRIKHRVLKLELLARNDQDEDDWKSSMFDDLEFMRILVQYSLKKKLAKSDYKKFKKLIKGKIESDETKNAMNVFLELAVFSMCTFPKVKVP